MKVVIDILKLFFNPFEYYEYIYIEGVQFKVYIVTHKISQMIGYRFRERSEVLQQEGMVFAFPTEREVEIVMSDVEFPIRVCQFDSENNKVGECYVLYPKSNKKLKIKTKCFIEFPIIT